MGGRWAAANDFNRLDNSDDSSNVACQLIRVGDGRREESERAIPASTQPRNQFNTGIRAYCGRSERDSKNRPIFCQSSLAASQ